GQDDYNPLGRTAPVGSENPTLKSGTDSTLLQSGTGSTLLQLGTESTLLQGGTQGALLQAAVEREGAPANILFLIDSSQSMKEKISVGSEGGKEPKMEAAKRVLQEALSRIPAEINLGLRVFGNGFRGDYSDCQQSSLLVPIGKSNRRAIIEAARSMAPYGLTPLTYGLMQAEQDLRYCVGPKTLILISDGAETCGGDPCAYIDRLSRIGVKMKVDIVGLGLKRDKQAQDQLNCIAQKSGGKYYDANTSAELVNSITNSVKQAISGKVLTKVSSPAIKDVIPADLSPLLPGNSKSTDLPKSSEEKEKP
ncbi:MAG: VWA domain-containing protein, partial [Candidatus Obscuribacterales bacterium]|nr:VWA domain-containing protein [Candidatus Obscuribacterales bacterium]